ncbi:hypothetical protein [Streptomyces apocyni]|uniref:hypothetical protein n=1 Tax=Streptomyces apocyni TaxID=2654677 RepID=UPI001E543C8C|nr:hypothetical protein [Streptomyces apocyni]
MAVTACEPVGSTMSATAVAVTTDQLGTAALERRDVDVQWLSCTANINQDGKTTTPNANRAVAHTSSSPSPSPSVRSVATVDCHGKTTDDKPLAINGKVTEELDGRCVRGDLTAKVDNQVVFKANMLGNCSATTEPPRTPPVTYDPTPTPTPAPTTPPDDPARPTVTETVTVTADPPPPCDCAPGK